MLRTITYVAIGALSLGLGAGGVAVAFKASAGATELSAALFAVISGSY